MSKEEEKETKVYVEGKLIPLRELEKEYAEISIAGTLGNVKVIGVLAKAEKPLDYTAIARRTNMSQGYSRSILKSLAKKKYVLEFRIGRARTLYYLLTEKGLKLSKDITK
ncbi:MAG: hypothetical protein OEW62_00850 [Candidatus Bathyarchaeota archaeon]|nr:hypothetical protein [Candidatus Bathyarchaeota archaeon]